MATIVIDKRKMLITITAFQLAFLSVIAVSKLELEIPAISILRSTSAIIYLTFIPGALMLRILKLDRYLGNLTEKVVFSVGLSISSLTFLGIFLNFLYPIIGIDKPFSELPLALGVSFFVALLIILCFCFSEKSNRRHSVNLKFRPCYIFVFSFLLLSLSILGTNTLNYQNDNTLLLILFCMIALIPILVNFGKVKESVYSILIWSISFSLLHYGAFTKPLYNDEKYMPAVVALMGYWDPTLKAGHNMLLPNVILHPMYIILAGIPFVWEWRIVHPLLFSVIPVLMYQIYRRMVDDKTAFLSTFLVTSTFIFYLLFSTQIRTPMATFYMVFFGFLIVDDKIPNKIKLPLMLVFSFLLISSHYGTSFIFLFVLISGSIIYLILERLSGKESTKNYLPFTFLAMYLVLAFSWYMYVANGARFINLSRFFTHFCESLISLEFFNPYGSYTTYALEHNYSTSINILKYMYIFVYLTAIIGIIKEIYNNIYKNTKNFDTYYLSISISFLGVMLSTLLPTKAYNTARVVFITLTFLAPFCVAGGYTIFQNIVMILSKILKFKNNLGNTNFTTVFAVFLMIFFLFNSGFISEVVTKDYAPYAIIGKGRIMKSNNTQYKLYLYRFYRPLCDIEMCKWITKYSDKNKILYSDFFISEGTLRYRNSFIPEYGLVPGHNNRPKVHRLTTNVKILKSNYILLGYHNIRDKFIVSQWNPVIYFSISKLYPTLIQSSKIYDNGGSRIYYT